MMNEKNQDLCRRIREKCRQQRWHGPDMENPHHFIARERERQEHQQQQIQRRMREREAVGEQEPFVSFLIRSSTFWYDKDGNGYEISLETDLETFPLQRDFEYPPATEEQLEDAERELGFSLHPLLRMIFATVANGGFGPGYSLSGVPGGFVEGVDGNFPPPEQFYKKSDAENGDFLIADVPDYQEIPFGVWPHSFYTLCHWGCGICSYLHRPSGRIYRGESASDATHLRCEANSLYGWLDSWVQGEDLWKKGYPINR